MTIETEEYETCYDGETEHNGSETVEMKIDYKGPVKTSRVPSFGKSLRLPSVTIWNYRVHQKKTLVYFLYYYAKSINAIGLKISAINVNIIWSIHAKNLG